MKYTTLDRTGLEGVRYLPECMSYGTPAWPRGSSACPIFVQELLATYLGAAQIHAHGEGGSARHQKCTSPSATRPIRAATFPSLIILLTVFFLFCTGCSDCAAKPLEARFTQKEPQEQGLEPLNKPLRLLDGEIDIKNKYVSTVMLRARVPSGIEVECNGVLVAPQLVLTAAHCVCMKYGLPSADSKGENVLDNSACAQSATATTVIYLPPRRPGEMRYLSEDHAGTVQVHPEFKSIISKKGDLASSHADLAVILLDEPVVDDFAPVALATSELSIHETVTTVGYGYAGPGGSNYEKRRFSQSKIVGFIKPENERVLLELPIRPLFSNDSGGPCLREADSGFTLVGVSNRGLGHRPTFTNIHPYRAWLLEKVRLAPLPKTSP